jgi:CRP/FNR family transcriptional regulator, anaerobic regulatory protein
MPQTQITPLRQVAESCRNCRLATLCLPDNVPCGEVAELEGIVQRRRAVPRGSVLFQTGKGFTSLYAVRTGSVKTSMLLSGGDEHISGFHLPGEILGLDTINFKQHQSSAVTLETTSVCEIPFRPLEKLANRYPSLQRRLVMIMSRELRSEQSVNHLLARRSAEQRLAVVLLSISERYASRGLAADRFRLPMSRHDLSNYLGLVPETMSRTFRRLETQGLLSTRGREIELIDLHGLHQLAHGENPSARSLHG